MGNHQAISENDIIYRGEAIIIEINSNVCKKIICNKRPIDSLLITRCKIGPKTRLILYFDSDQVHYDNTFDNQIITINSLDNPPVKYAETIILPDYDVVNIKPPNDPLISPQYSMVYINK